MKWVVEKKDGKIVSPAFLEGAAPEAKSIRKWGDVNSAYFVSLDADDEIINDGNEESMKAMNKQGFRGRGLWAEYFFDKKDYPLTKENKTRYEMFCSGWLHYYEVMVRNASIDYEIYFKWNEHGKVEVYLSPLPKKVRSRLQPTTGHHMPMKMEVGKDGSPKSGSSVFVVSKDPPEPPPPPPPPM